MVKVCRTDFAKLDVCLKIIEVLIQTDMNFLCNHYTISSHPVPSIQITSPIPNPVCSNPTTSNMSTVNTHQTEFSLPSRTNQQGRGEEETHHTRPVKHTQVSPDTVSRSDHDTTKIGFLMLPREIRDRIYEEVLQPKVELGGDHSEGSNMHLGCTVLLQLCSQIYHESIEILHCQEFDFSINSAYPWSFRDPKAFGKPALFTSDEDWRSNPGLLPSRFSELEFVRLRRICFTFEFGAKYLASPDFSYSHRELNYSILNKLKMTAETFARVIPKMTHIEQIRLQLRYEANIDYDDEPELRLESVQPLLDAIAARDISLILGPHQVWYNYLLVASKDDLTDWLDWMVEHLKIRVSRVPDRGLPDAYLVRKRLDLLDYSERRHMILGVKSAWHKKQSQIIEQRLEQARKDSEIPIEIYGEPKVAYRLIPECRTCSSIFASQELLQAHLEAIPEHLTRFRKFQYNIIPSHAWRLADERCWTCAAGFDELDELKKHLDSTGHRRSGIIPRFQIDNDKYDLSYEIDLLPELYGNFTYFNLTRQWVRHEPKIISDDIQHMIGYRGNGVNRIIFQEEDEDVDVQDNAQ